LTITIVIDYNDSNVVTEGYMPKRVRSHVKQLRFNKAAAEKRTISIREVSRETGIAVSTLRRIEANEAEGVDFATLTKLAEYYGAQNIGDLLSFEDARRALRLALA
jgi:DNA-binding Xre family transcriptional regulator